MFAAEEDEHGTYFMNSKDLRAVQHVDRLTKWASPHSKLKAVLNPILLCPYCSNLSKSH